METLPIPPTPGQALGFEPLSPALFGGVSGCSWVPLPPLQSTQWEYSVRTALISDIHGNLEALRVVLDDIDAKRSVDRIICLGDILGYGPDPGRLC